MARSLNKVMLIGNVADEPVIRTYNGGSSKVANITVVTNEYRSSEQGQPPIEIPEWHRVVIWGRLAEITENYVHKGTKVFVEGRLRTNSYVDKEGIKRYATDIHADQLILLSSNPNAAQYQQGQNAYRAATNTDGTYGGYNQTNGNMGMNNNTNAQYGAVNMQNGYSNTMPPQNINPSQSVGSGMPAAGMNSVNSIPNVAMGNSFATNAQPAYTSIQQAPIAGDGNSFNQANAMPSPSFTNAAPQGAMEPVNNFNNVAPMNQPMAEPNVMASAPSNEVNQYSATSIGQENVDSNNLNEDDLPF